ncbi:MAG: prolyl oligopeptidase family serine peptidase [Actinomycetota bacterium]
MTDSTHATGDSASFPRRSAATQRFTLGAPRTVEISPDGRRITFLRSGGGDDPLHSLWVFDVESGDERVVADPATLGSSGDEMTDAERARRERARDGAAGITSYATDSACKVAAFALDGRLYTAGLLTGNARELRVEGPVFDPRPDPLAHRLAYVSGTQLRIGELDGSSRALAGEGEPDGVSWGRAEFIAAEEMGRFRGYWWSPDGTRLAACRVDERPVAEWTIADPARPDSPARTVRYPAAGEANAVVTLHVLDVDGGRLDVDWDREFFPYVTRVEWTDHGLLFGALSRDQRSSIVCDVDLETGDAAVIASDYDDAWVEIVPGTPTRTPSGRLVTASDRDGVRRLLVDDEPATPLGLQIRSLVATRSGEGDVDELVVLANDPTEPSEVQVHVVKVGDALTTTPLTDAPGVHAASVGGPTVLLRTTGLAAPGPTFLVHGTGVRVPSSTERPPMRPNVAIQRVGERRLVTALLLPQGHTTGRLPVLLDPYGGPHAQRVVSSNDAFLASQWFADQGFAVVVTDGRGTPGRGSEWERAVHHDLSTCVLDDQIDALHGLAAMNDVLDLDRVAIRGWSFGGYLAALAVLRRPDVFHAAIAGAPVTDWRLYDTCYTERYLGDPTTADGAEVYDANSLFPLVDQLERPLLLVHGLADDNVVAAHTLQLSSALLAAGKVHEVLPLSGVTHMTPQEVVAENLLLHQMAFLRRALDVA